MKKNLGGSSLILNNLVSNVVNWAQTPLDAAAGGGGASVHHKASTSSFLNPLTALRSRAGRSCSTASAPFNMTNNTHLHRNSRF